MKANVQRVALYALTVGLTCTLFLAYHGPFGGGSTKSNRRSRPPVELIQKPKNPRATGEEPTWWIETLSTEPRIFRIHDLLTPTECDHLIKLGVEKGLKTALITPYGTHELVESTTRTNKQAWLDYGQDAVVSYLEETLATVTGTTAKHGENLQILHYNKTQEFQEHHDYFDPATDPPENFEKGGNRLATVLIYLRGAEEGGETFFSQIDKKLTAKTGDAIMFFNLKAGCDGTNKDCVDKLTAHAGMPPTKGEKWVATKWIHERSYQDAEETECVDREKECPKWARRSPSECEVNHEWMMFNCRKSCTHC